MVPLPEIIAHRGASEAAPENTAAAFARAWSEGADGIETDLRMTRHGQIVCIHDATTARTADRRLAVSAARLDDLQRLDAGSWKGGGWAGERIPTLAEVLAHLPEGKKAYLELKSGVEMLGPLKAALEGARVEAGRIRLLAFDAAVLAAAGRLLPQYRTSWLTGFRRLFTGRWSPTLPEVLATVRQCGATGLAAAAAPCLDSAFVKGLKAEELELQVWTVNDAALAARLAEMGVEALITDRPGWLRAQLSA